MENQLDLYYFIKNKNGTIIEKNTYIDESYFIDANKFFNLPLSDSMIFYNFLNKRWYQKVFLKKQDRDIITYTDVTNLISRIIILNEDLLERNQKISSLEYDNTTNLYTKDVAIEFIKEIITSNDKACYTFVMIDLDFFKQVNDTYGHLVGDEVLKKIGNILKSSVRSEDMAARFGGEEFLLIFKNMNLDVLSKRLEQIKNMIANTSFFANDVSFHITASFGVTNYIPSNLDFYDSKQLDDIYNKILNEADEALYHSKINGRDQITNYSSLNLCKQKRKLN